MWCDQAVVADPLDPRLVKVAHVTGVTPKGDSQPISIVESIDLAVRMMRRPKSCTQTGPTEKVI